MKKLLRKLILYYKYPNQFWSDYHTLLNKPRAHKLGVSFLQPNYIFFGKFNKDSTIIDVGCGYLAEFSEYLINKFDLKVFAVDPTKKHSDNLKDIEKKYPNNFTHFPFAISKDNGTITFHETLDNESGSVLKEHANVLRDRTREYNVETKNLKTLVADLKLKKIDLLKLDIEGAEYELLESVEKEDLAPFDQIFIEFHHVAVKKYSSKDTKRIVKKIHDFGFNVFTLDKVNFLFYKN